MRLSPFWMAAAISFVAAGATAAGPTDAELLFREARKLAVARDWAAACPKFAESERLDPAPGTLLNLADCEEHFGTLVSAREHFALAAAGFRQKDKGRAVALARVAALDARIAHLTLRLAPSVPPTAVVRKAGVVVDPATLGQPVPADPGSLDVVVSLTGHADRKYTLTLGDGANVQQELDLGVPDAPPPRPEEAAHLATTEPPPPVAPSLPPVPPPPPPSHVSLPGLGLLGLGAASIVVGAVSGGLALGDASIAKSDCSKLSQTCSPTGHNAAVSVDTLSTVSTVTFIAGGVLAAAGGYFLLFRGSSGASPSTAFVPVVSPVGVGAMLRRSF